MPKHQLEATNLNMGQYRHRNPMKAGFQCANCRQTFAIPSGVKVVETFKNEQEKKACPQ